MKTNTANLNNFANNIIPTEDPPWDLQLAYDLGVLDGSLTVEESVGGNDPGDLYQITIEETGEYTFNLDGLTSNADLAIFDADGQMIDSSVLTGTASESFSLNLNSGTYYVGVASADGSLTDYSLDISDGDSDGDDDGGIGDPETIIPEEDPSPPGDNAYDLGTIEGNLTVEESVGGTDQADLYQITIEEAGEYTFNLDDLTANADLYLFDPNNAGDDGRIAPFEDSKLPDNQSEEIVVDLDVGTYHVGVFSADDSPTDYSLNISDGNGDDDGGITDPETIIPEEDPGYGNDNAYDLGTIEGSLTVEESVGGNDQNDGYIITIDEAGEYTFNLEDLTANADLYLFDPNDTGDDGSIPPFESSELSGAQSEEIVVDLDVGTYYVGVASADGDLTDYSLNISDGGIADEDIDPNPDNDPGETFETAENIGNLTGGINNYTYTTSDSVSDIDPIDLYQFTTETTRELNVFLNGLTADADLRLYDSNSELLGVSENYDSEPENLSETIDAGTYYVGVFSYDDVETDYNLNIVINPGSTSSSPVAMDAITNPMSEDFSLV